MEELPAFSVDLIREMDSMYPPIAPDDIYRKDREELIKIAAQREMIDALKARVDEDVPGGF